MRRKIVFEATLGELAEVPGTPFAYWAPRSLRRLFREFPPLDRDVAKRKEAPKIADVKVGLQTSDDLRFTRYFWEVPIEEIATSREETFQGKKWVPFAKGGKPFFHDIQLVVNWENDGEEIRNFPNAVIRNESFYFREGLAWADIVSVPQFDMHFLHAGVIFAVGAHALFPKNHEHLWAILGWGNSALAWICFRLMEPTAHHKHIGYVSKLPINPAIFQNERLSSLAKEAHDLLREWATGDEPSTVFIKPWLLQVWDAMNGCWDEGKAIPRTSHPLSRDFEWSEAGRSLHLPWRLASGEEEPPDFEREGLFALAEACVEWERRLRRRIEKIQREIDDEVYRIYGISDEDRALIEAELSSPPEAGEEGEEAAEGAEGGEEEAAGEGEVLPPEEHIRRLLHFLVHEVMKEDPDGIVPLHDQYLVGGRREPGLATRVREKVAQIFGEGRACRILADIERALGRRLEEWLAFDFFPYHVGLYRLRPIIWQITTGGRRPAFSCFIYWHKLDQDTLRKVRHIYLLPCLEAVERELKAAEEEFLLLREGGATGRQMREAEKRLADARGRHEALRKLDEAIERLLRPMSVEVSSRSEWVREKVAEISSQGYRPNLDYGVRVNIEPLKRAGIIHPAAERVKG